MTVMTTSNPDQGGTNHGKVGLRTEGALVQNRLPDGIRNPVSARCQ
jgi:hypothetical protein